MSASSTGNVVRIVEVGPRDGLQNIAATIPLSTKLELINQLHRTGLQTIELTSVVSSRSIPQLADCQVLLSDPGIQKLLHDNRFRLPVLIPNLKGLRIAIQKNVREVAVFVSASEGFSTANINCSVLQGLERAREVARSAQSHGIAVRGYVSCIFACPYDGPTPQTAVLNCVRQLIDMGCYEISLGDTLGVGVASDVKSLVKFLTASNILVGQLAGHFHDTYGQAVSNAWAAWECGVRVFDSSVSGLGGCPYAPGAKGNVATEDLVYMFQQAGISSGIDLASLVKTGVWISNQLSKQNESRAGNALVVKEKLRTSSSSSSTSTSTNPRRTSIAVVNLSWTSMKDEDGLEIHKSGPNVKITLNRPRNGNALTISMISNLTAFFENTKNDRFITRIAITARGKYFCTGMDLGKNSTAVSEGGSTSAAQFTRLTRLFEVIDNAPQVTVACIQGPAFGGGVGLAFACDVRIATKNASMTLSEVRLGLCPATISKYILREWGSGFAREAMLSGRVVSMDELVRLGVVAGQLANSEAELSSMLDDYLARLRAAAPRASSMCKDLVRLNWIDGGGQKQAEGIRALFDEMMAEKAEAAYGVEQFQGGNRAVDWDAYVRRKFASKL